MIISKHLASNQKVLAMTVKPSCEITFQWPEENKFRAREVVKRSNPMVTGKYPSLKAGRMVQWESQLERDALYLMDASPLVRELGEQPVKLSFILNGEERDHFPDFLSNVDGIKVFVEVKPEDKSQKQYYQDRTNFLEKTLPIYGYRYLVITEKDIRQKTRLEIAKFILRHGRVPLASKKKEILRRTLQEMPNLRWGDVEQKRIPTKLISGICRFLLDGYLHINPHQKNSKFIPPLEKIPTLKEALLWA